MFRENSNLEDRGGKAHRYENSGLRVAESMNPASQVLAKYLAEKITAIVLKNRILYFK